MSVWVFRSGFVAVLLFLAGLGGYEALQAHDAQLKAEGVQAVQEQKAKADEAVKEQAKADQAKIDQAKDDALEAITKQRTIVVTPQQAAAVANTLPNLPQQVQVQTVPATATAPATSQIVIPSADIPAFQKYKLDCDESNVKLTACSLTAAKSDIIQKATDDQLRAMTVDRDSWKATAKGGTFWQKLGKTGKCLVMSGGGAGIGAAIDSKHAIRGAVIGGSAGTVGCTLWGW